MALVGCKAAVPCRGHQLSARRNIAPVANIPRRAALRGPGRGMAGPITAISTVEEITVSSMLPEKALDVNWPPRTNKPRVLVLGSGWGAIAFIQKLDPNYYDAALVSPRNYFLCVKPHSLLLKSVLRRLPIFAPIFFCYSSHLQH